MQDKNVRGERAKLLRAGLMRTAVCERKVLVRDISANGAKVQTDIHVDVGETVYLSFGDYPEQCATVRWVRGDHIGVLFERDVALDGNAQPVLGRLNRAAKQDSWISYRHVNMTKADF